MFARISLFVCMGKSYPRLTLGSRAEDLCGGRADMVVGSPDPFTTNTLTTFSISTSLDYATFGLGRITEKWVFSPLEMLPLPVQPGRSLHH